MTTPRSSIEDLIAGISRENINIRATLNELKNREQEVAANADKYCLIFPLEESLFILSTNVTNIIKANILYFMGYFAQYETFPVSVFERDNVFDHIFQFLSAKTMLRNQAIHVFQNASSRSRKILEKLVDHDIMGMILESPPYYRLIPVFIEVIRQSNDHTYDNELSVFEEMIKRYCTSGEKEIVQGLSLATFLLNKYGSDINISCIDIDVFLQSKSKIIPIQVANLLLCIENPNIKYIDILINAFLDGYLPLENVFKLLLKNHHEWSGFRKDIVIEFIRSSIPDATYNVAKLGVELFLAYGCTVEEWDENIVNTIARFASDKDLTTQILTLFCQVIDLRKDLGEMNDIMENLIHVAEESLHSSNIEESQIASYFLQLIQEI